MQPDDELCLCFHVTVRKVRNWLRIHRPQRPGQISDCFGAGTGCGWCRPYLERLFHEAALEAPNAGTSPGDQADQLSGLPDPDEYRKNRKLWIRERDLPAAGKSGQDQPTADAEDQSPFPNEDQTLP